jgi:hypothetical protein
LGIGRRDRGELRRRRQRWSIAAQQQRSAESIWTGETVQDQIRDKDCAYLPPCSGSASTASCQCSSLLPPLPPRSIHPNESPTSPQLRNSAPQFRGKHTVNSILNRVRRDNNRVISGNIGGIDLSLEQDAHSGLVHCLYSRLGVAVDFVEADVILGFVSVDQFLIRIKSSHGWEGVVGGSQGFPGRRQGSQGFPWASRTLSDVVKLWGGLKPQNQESGIWNQD